MGCLSSVMSIITATCLLGTRSVPAAVDCGVSMRNAGWCFSSDVLLNSVHRTSQTSSVSTAAVSVMWNIRSSISRTGPTMRLLFRWV